MQPIIAASLQWHCNGTNLTAMRLKMNIVDVIQDLGFSPRKKSATEHCSACPYCQDGTDRFTIWPQKGNCGRFWCRVCDKKGDAINLLRDLQGLTYRQACERLKLKPTMRHTPRADQAPLIAEDPPSLWMEKAASFVEWSHSQLLSNENFLSALHNRGMTRS